MTDSHMWTDEQLSAFLDGELAPAEMERLTREIETDARLAARVERLGAANSAYIAAIGAIDAQPLAPGVETLLAAPPAAKILPFRPRAWLSEHRALAASLLCAAIVGGVASGLRPQPDPFAPKADGFIAQSSLLHQALESGASGEAVLISAGVSATPTLTFAADDGSWCRQFDVSSSKGTTSAIACRDKGAWRTKVAVYGRPPATPDYHSVSGDKSPALEAFIDRHISGPALSADQESQAIKKGWE